jgi:hypothetical protein
MSQRHRTVEVPLPPKQELRAHAHSERHRIHVELNQVASKVSAGLDPSDVHEPGAAWKPMHHHDPEVAKSVRRRFGSPANRNRRDRAQSQSLLSSSRRSDQSSAVMAKRRWSSQTPAISR